MPSTTVKPRKRGINPNKLSDVERIFCAEYLANGRNGTEACAEAYPNIKRPGAYASTLLSRPKVKAYLGKLLSVCIADAELTTKRVLKHLETTLFLDPIHLFEKGDIDGTYKVKSLDEIPPHIRQCIKSIKSKTRFDEVGEFIDCWVEIELMDKDKAMNMAMKHLGLLKEAGININVGMPTIDFDKLCDPSNEKDVIESRIAGSVPRLETDNIIDSKNDDQTAQEKAVVIPG